MRRLLRRFWGQHALLFLFFLLLSFSFWLFQALNETYEYEVAVPLRLDGVPDNVVITSDIPECVHMRVRDKGVNLLSYIYVNPIDTIVINWGDYSTGNGHFRVTLGDLIKNAKKRVEGQVLGVRPDTMLIYYNYGQRKRLPVRFVGNLQATDGLPVVSVSPTYVYVYAPPQILDTLTAAYLQRLDLKDISDTIVRYQPFMKLRGVKYAKPTAKVRIYADKVTTKSVTVPVVGVNFPATKVLRTIPSTVQIRFNVPSHREKEITAESFAIVVRYEELLEHSDEHQLQLSLQSTPSGVSNVSITPSAVEYIIEEVTSEE